MIEIVKEFFSVLFPDKKMAMIAAAIAGVLVIAFAITVGGCGENAKPTAKRINANFELVDERGEHPSSQVQEATNTLKGNQKSWEDELEILPPTRTGLTREIGRYVLREGDCAAWTKLSPAGKLAIMRYEVRTHFKGEAMSEEEFLDRASALVNYLDEMALTKSNAELKIPFVLNLLYTFDKNRSKK